MQLKYQQHTYNHINPKSWKGDVCVCNVVLLACWSSGHHSAELALQEAQLSLPFDRMIQAGGHDILSPFRQSKMMLVDGTLFAGEEEETGGTQFKTISNSSNTGILRAIGKFIRQCHFTSHSCSYSQVFVRCRPQPWTQLWWCSWYHRGKQFQ